MRTTPGLGTALVEKFVGDKDFARWHVRDGESSRAGLRREVKMG
jgi:hypothetical protein